MGKFEDPFRALEVERDAPSISVPASRPCRSVPLATPAIAGVVTGRLHGFDLDDQPLVSGLPLGVGLVVAARTTIDLSRSMVGEAVVVVFENEDAARPIVIGVVRSNQAAAPSIEAPASQPLVVCADDERFVVRAEREIVLSCGDASITLTRAGKVIIKGRYILSRSSGYNKIKGAAVDIN